MEKIKIFEEIMGKSQQLVVASSMNDQSNLRLMRFFYREGTIYLTTVKESPKVKEFENPKVSFTTLLTDQGVIKVPAGLIKKSQLSAEELLQMFHEYGPTKDPLLDEKASELIVYELSFKEALMTTKSGLHIVTKNDLLKEKRTSK